MKFAIVGLGRMGLSLGGRALQRGHEVSLAEELGTEQCAKPATSPAGDQSLTLCSGRPGQQFRHKPGLGVQG